MWDPTTSMFLMVLLASAWAFKFTASPPPPPLTSYYLCLRPVEKEDTRFEPLPYVTGRGERWNPMRSEFK